MRDFPWFDLLEPATRLQFSVAVLLLFARWQAGRRNSITALPWVLAVVATSSALALVGLAETVVALSYWIVVGLAAVVWNIDIEPPWLHEIMVDDRPLLVLSLALELLAVVVIVQFVARRWSRLVAALAAPVACGDEVSRARRQAG